MNPMRILMLTFLCTVAAAHSPHLRGLRNGHLMEIRNEKNQPNKRSLQGEHEIETNHHWHDARYEPESEIIDPQIETSKHKAHEGRKLKKHWKKKWPKPYKWPEHKNHHPNKKDHDKYHYPKKHPLHKKHCPGRGCHQSKHKVKKQKYPGYTHFGDWY